MTTLGALTATVNTRAKGRIRGSVSIDMPDLGTLYVTESGAIESVQAAEITLTANSKIFKNILDGAQNPATAFMSGKLKVDGNPMRALKIGEILSSDP